MRGSLPNFIHSIATSRLVRFQIIPSTQCFQNPPPRPSSQELISPFLPPFKSIVQSLAHHSSSYFSRRVSAFNRKRLCVPRAHFGANEGSLDSGDDSDGSIDSLDSKVCVGHSSSVCFFDSHSFILN